jgi:hypothetical protein
MSSRFRVAPARVSRTFILHFKTLDLRKFRPPLRSYRLLSLHRSFDAVSFRISSFHFFPFFRI